MYGDAFIFEHQAIVTGDLARFRAAEEKWRIGWTILAPGAPLAKRLDAMPGWKRLYADDWAVVHVKSR
jgi:hypothetical protein